MIRPIFNEGVGPASRKWSWAGPDEGDGADQSVWLLYDHEETILLQGRSLNRRKDIAAMLTDLLNEAEAEVSYG
jgi:hypothetical protein